MYCNHCGTKNPKASDYCFNCGSSMSSPPQTEHSATAQSTAVAKTVAPAKPANVLARIDVAGTSLVISERDVTFGSQVLRCDEVVGIRYGIYKHYLNGIRTSQSYAIWLTDGRSTIYIECAKGFFVLSSTIEARYQQAIKALYSAVIVPLMQSFLLNLDTGPGFQIGGVTFDRDGLHRSSSLGAIQKGIIGAWASLTGGASAEIREQRHQHLAWADFGGHSLANGNVYLFRNKETWAQLPLRDTWNAVCLGPLFDFLYEDGRLWQFVGKRAQTASPVRTLVVDDDEAVREIICSMLTSGGYDPYGVAGGTEALALLEAGENFEILVSDVLNHPMDGLTLLQTAKAKFPHIPVVIASAVNDSSVIEACIKSGAYEYLVHPVTREKLLDSVRAALAAHHGAEIHKAQS